MRGLFARLWRELDLDDHPHTGGHGCEPEGELRLEVRPDAVVVGDARVDLGLAGSMAGLATIVDELDGETARPWSATLLSEQGAMLRPRPGRLGVHRWTLPTTCLGAEVVEALADLGVRPALGDEVDAARGWAWPVLIPGVSAHQRSGQDVRWSDVLSGLPGEGAGSGDGWSGEGLAAGWRVVLETLHRQLADRLPGWTWHLEIDSKSDRTCWYVRPPQAWSSLFTLIIGLCWRPESPQRAEGLVMFERTPPGELDRLDRAEENAADTRRTGELEAADGALSRLAGVTVAQATGVLRVEPDRWQRGGGWFEVWPSALGRWPLAVAHGGPPGSLTDLVAWCDRVLGALGPAVTQLADVS